MQTKICRFYQGRGWTSSLLAWRVYRLGDPVELPELQRRFGEMLRRHRRRVGTGQDKLAGQAGIHRTHLSLLERGKQMPSLAVIHKLATAPGVATAALMA